jgi:hypothetical protein
LRGFSICRPDAHNQVVINACQLLGDHFYPKICRVYTENVRLLINEGEEYRLLDVLVTCSERDRVSLDAKRDPVVLVEVLSSATLLTGFGGAGRLLPQDYFPPSLFDLIINPAQVWASLYQRSTTTSERLPDQALTYLQAGFLVETLPLALPCLTYTG